jgi:hypothetical protein
MRETTGLPHERIRHAIFWILISTWPVFRIVEMIWHPPWYDRAEDVAASLTFLAFLLGRWLYLDTQKKVCERLDDIERAWQLMYPGDDRPGLTLIPGRRT